jgi:anti-sigma-K factor RskA
MSTPSLPPEDRAPNGTEPPDDEVLAAELVLGVLGAAERRAAQARVESDPQFAARTVRWEQRLAPWLAGFAPAAAPARIWLQICQRLGWRAEPASSPGWWQSLALWRTAAAVAAFAALALWFTRGPAPQAPPVARVQPAGGEAAAAKPVTTLAHDDGTPGWLASVDASRGTVLMVPVPSAPDAQGRVPELWVIPAGQAPRSLGQVSINKSHTVAVPPDARTALVRGSVLAITLEPAGGIPHARPSGPVIAKGAIQT